MKDRLRRVVAVAAAAVAALIASTPNHGLAQPDTGGVLARVAETGTLRVGTRAQARPFAFRNSEGKFAGFSVDLLQYIGRQIGNTVGRDVTLDFHAVTTDTRLKALESGRIDLVCGLTTPTWSREERVDFTLPIFVDGTRVLTYREYGQAGLGGLQNRRVGVLEDSTTESIVALTLPSVDVVPYPSMAKAMTALEARKVDAIANIGILLETLRTRSSNSVSLMLVPKSGNLHREIMACAVPENESPLRDAVNKALSQAYEGLDEVSGNYADIYFRWFGVDGSVYYPLTGKRRNILLSSRIWLR